MNEEITQEETVELCLEFHINELTNLMKHALQKYLNGDITKKSFGQLLHSFSNDLIRLGDYAIKEER